MPKCTVDLDNLISIKSVHDQQCVLFWSIKNSYGVLNKLNSRSLRSSSLSRCDFSTLYFTLPHNLIKEKKMIKLIGHLIGKVTLHVTEEMLFFTSKKHKNDTVWSYQKVMKLSLFYLAIFI